MQPCQSPRCVQVIGHMGKNSVIQSGRLGPLHQLMPFVQRARRLLRLLFCPIHWLAIMSRQKNKADHLARNIPVQQIAHGEEVAQGFGHFLTLDLQHFVVHPDLCKTALGMRTAALRDLILMMRKQQIIAAAMNIKTMAKKLIRHRRAFDMPARASTSPGAWPARRLRIRGFPQDKIHRVALIGGHFHPCACNHVIHTPAR